MILKTESTRMQTFKYEDWDLNIKKEAHMGFFSKLFGKKDGKLTNEQLDQIDDKVEESEKKHVFDRQIITNLLRQGKVVKKPTPAVKMTVSTFKTATKVEPAKIPKKPAKKAKPAKRLVKAKKSSKKARPAREKAKKSTAKKRRK